MLSYLHVKNIALIDELEVEFNEGLNIITGETGAGKSIIVGSINLALGAKASKDFIKKDCQFALIELIFSAKSEELNRFLEENDFESGDQIIVSRKISQNSRSVYKINGELANASLVNQLSTILIDIHSQKEHQSVLIKKNHIRLLDRFLGDKLNPLLDQLSLKIKDYNVLMLEINKGTLDDKQRLREISFLEHEINEIESASLVVGEDVRLDAEYKRLYNTDKTVRALSQVEEYINGQASNNGAAFLISQAIKDISEVKDLDLSIGGLSDALEQIDYLLADFSRDLVSYAENLNTDENYLEEVTNRIDTINRLKSKYGSSIEEILELLDEKKKSLENYIHFEERIQELKLRMNQLENKISDICAKLSRIREKGAVVLSHKITEALQSLNFAKADFKVQVIRKNRFSADGLDNVEFFITTNEGEKLKPMNHVASGGEISRIMLAIKTIIADYDDIDTLIFDEIDRGISGRTAQKVAEKMTNLSMSRQIICITHLPQIASMADAHFVVNKTSDNNSSLVTIDRLAEDEVSIELARLLGGVSITQSVVDSAKEMKQLANQYKSKL